jgi:DNA-binding response OmpR family regulator
VRSTAGQGSEFRVALPASVPRLLVVSLLDADAAMAEQAAGSLEGEMLRAAGSEEALRLAGQRTPQAVLVDGATPCAVKTLHGLRTDAVLRGVPVLWLGPPDPPLGAAPDDRLIRPLDPAALRAALRFSFGG